jgi:hypothetical protein
MCGTSLTSLIAVLFLLSVGKFFFASIRRKKKKSTMSSQKEQELDRMLDGLSETEKEAWAAANNRAWPLQKHTERWQGAPGTDQDQDINYYPCCFEFEDVDSVYCKNRKKEE